MTATQTRAPEAPTRPTDNAARRWTTPGVLLVLVIGLAALPTLQESLGLDAYLIVFGYTLFFWVTQASAWNLFSGFSGYLNFGHAIFYGAGVYVTANLARESDPNIFVAILGGALAAAVVAALIGYVIFHRGLAHEIFALFTFALAIAIGVLVRNVDAIGGGGVLMVSMVTYPEFLGSVNEMLYYLGLLLAVVAVVAAALVQRSRLGLGLFAIRDDERVAETMGVPTFRYKMIALVLAAAIGGASGALNAVMISFIEPEATFGIDVSVMVVLMALVGGRRHWAGPVIGAVLMFSLSDRLTGLGMTELSQLLTGLLLVVVIVGLKGGIHERWQRRPRAGLITFLGVLLVLLVTGLGGGFIGALLFALLAMIVVLVVPDAWWARLVNRSREGQPR
ncbi:branched-chain amino acid ABC transporter permease [Ornithinimicrobium sp. F0845]|uniref:branched-chain amino acid ABC transporter permease n=1 Tax=Ornithinimicrobium sp. F0845 TaxID=2926412 RepID=UPI001FF67525|nr:branched-chain amino acid ABC transporter permease [Ornithinimicrobium sp. F0845]MCK0114227.1 branched-chain amino acid ABC transporter permease [Ornithinimicrobium sp. F0845]